MLKLFFNPSIIRHASDKMTEGLKADMSINRNFTNSDNAAATYLYFRCTRLQTDKGHIHCLLVDMNGIDNCFIRNIILYFVKIIYSLNRYFERKAFTLRYLSRFGSYCDISAAACFSAIVWTCEVVSRTVSSTLPLNWKKVFNSVPSHPAKINRTVRKLSVVCGKGVKKSIRNCCSDICRWWVSPALQFTL